MWLPHLGEAEWALVSLAILRDNILVVATGIGAAWAMADVCRLLANAWSLRVLCSCISETNLECAPFPHSCMGPETWSSFTVGVSCQ